MQKMSKTATFLLPMYISQRPPPKRTLFFYSIKISKSVENCQIKDIKQKQNQKKIAKRASSISTVACIPK